MTDRESQTTDLKDKEITRLENLARRSMDVDRAAEKMAEVIKRAAKQFSYYEEQHATKNPPDLLKAKINHEYAVLCYEALTGWREANV